MTDAEKLKKLLESNKTYWGQRSLLTTLDTVQKEEDYSRRLRAIYDAANKEIEDKLAATFARYAKNNNITNKEAYKILPKEAQANYKGNVMEYISKAKAHASDPAWTQYLLNESLKHKYTVLDQLRTEWKRVIYDLDTNGDKFLGKIYQNSNYQSQFNNQFIGLQNSFSSISTDKIDMLLKQDWTGTGSFSEKIWTDKNKLALALDDILVNGIATGKSLDKMSKDLAKRMDTSFNNAYRLIRTESARMNNQGLLDSFKELEVEEFEFIATLDNRTSEICQHMDGETFKIEDAVIGLNVPPLHPYCRSVIAPKIMDTKVEKRMMRDPETGKSVMGEWKTYPEYLRDNLGDKEKADAIISNKNDLATLTKAIRPIGNKTNTIELINNALSNIMINNPIAEPLNGDERKAIVKYVSDGYKTLNEGLREDLVLSNADKQLMKDLDTALKKCDIYSGNLIRDIKVDDLSEFLESYQIGDIVNFKQYISTNSDMSKQFNPNPNVVYTIKGKVGRDVRKYNASEAEILFERNSKFIILDIKYDESIDILFIDMEQVI